MDERLRQAEQQFQLEPSSETALELIRHRHRVGVVNREAIEDAANIGFIPARQLLNFPNKPFKTGNLIEHPLLAVKFALTMIYICLESLSGSALLKAGILYPHHSSGRELEYWQKRSTEHHIDWNPKADFGELIIISALKCAKDVIDAYDIPDFDYHKEWSMERYGWNGRIQDVMTDHWESHYRWTPAARSILKAINALLSIIEWPAPPDGRWGPTHLQKQRPLDDIEDDVLREVLMEERARKPKHGFSKYQIDYFKVIINQIVRAYSLAWKIPASEAKKFLVEETQKRLTSNLLNID